MTILYHIRPFIAIAMIASTLDRCSCIVADKNAVVFNRLAKIAAAFSPHINIADIESVQVLKLDENHIDLEAVVCQADGCGPIKVPVRFPNPRSPADSLKNSIIRNLDQLDEFAEEKLDQLAWARAQPPHVSERKEFLYDPRLGTDIVRVFNREEYADGFVRIIAQDFEEMVVEYSEGPNEIQLDPVSDVYLVEEGYNPDYVFNVGDYKSSDSKYDTKLTAATSEQEILTSGGWQKVADKPIEAKVATPEVWQKVAKPSKADVATSEGWQKVPKPSEADVAAPDTDVDLEMKKFKDNTTEILLANQILSALKSMQEKEVSTVLKTLESIPETGVNTALETLASMQKTRVNKTMKTLESMQKTQVNTTMKTLESMQKMNDPKMAKSRYLPRIFRAWVAVDKLALPALEEEDWEGMNEVWFRLGDATIAMPLYASSIDGARSSINTKRKKKSPAQVALKKQAQVYTKACKNLGTAVEKRDKKNARVALSIARESLGSYRKIAQIDDDRVLATLANEATFSLSTKSDRIDPIGHLQKDYNASNALEALHEIENKMQESNATRKNMLRKRG